MQWRRADPTKFLHFAQLSIYFYSTTNNQSTLHVRLWLLAAYQTFVGPFCWWILGWLAPTLLISNSPMSHHPSEGIFECTSWELPSISQWQTGQATVHSWNNSQDHLFFPCAHGIFLSWTVTSSSRTKSSPTVIQGLTTGSRIESMWTWWVSLPFLLPGTSYKIMSGLKLYPTNSLPGEGLRASRLLQ